MPQLDRPEAGWRDEDTQLAQLIGCAGLGIGREIVWGFDNRILCRLINAIGQIRFATGAFEQGFDATVPNPIKKLRAVSDDIETNSVSTI